MKTSEDKWHQDPDNPTRAIRVTQVGSTIRKEVRILDEDEAIKAYDNMDRLVWVGVPGALLIFTTFIVLMPPHILWLKAAVALIGLAGAAFTWWVGRARFKEWNELVKETSDLR